MRVVVCKFKGSAAVWCARVVRRMLRGARGACVPRVGGWAGAMGVGRGGLGLGYRAMVATAGTWGGSGGVGEELVGAGVTDLDSSKLGAQCDVRSIDTELIQLRGDNVSFSRCAGQSLLVLNWPEVKVCTELCST